MCYYRLDEEAVELAIQKEAKVWIIKLLRAMIPHLGLAVAKQICEGAYFQSSDYRMNLINEILEMKGLKPFCICWHAERYYDGDADWTIVERPAWLKKNVIVRRRIDKKAVDTITEVPNTHIELYCNGRYNMSDFLTIWEPIMDDRWTGGFVTIGD